MPGCIFAAKDDSPPRNPEFKVRSLTIGGIKQTEHLVHDRGAQYFNPRRAGLTRSCMVRRIACALCSLTLPAGRRSTPGLF